MTPRKPSTRTCLLTWGGLLALTLLTSLVGLIDLGPMTVVIAIVIATCKATLIGLFFMEALYDSKLIRVSAAAGILWLLFLMSLTATDYLSRGWLLPSGK